MAESVIPNPNGGQKEAVIDADAASWIDLPNDLRDLILERLSLTDYLRFPAVCKKWLSIHRSHRLRRRSFPGRRLPWIIASECRSYQYCFPRDPDICCSPFEDHRPYRPPKVPISLSKSRYLATSSDGFFLLLKGNSCSLVNPLTGSRLPLPPPPCELEYRYDLVAAISPPSVFPYFTVIAFYGRICLLRAGDRGWTLLSSPDGEQVESVVFCAGKFYCTCFGNDQLLVIIDPLLPELHPFKMDHNQLMFGHSRNILAECNGQVLRVQIEGGSLSYDGERIKVCTADLSGMKWVSTQCIRDRMLLLDELSSISLLALDIGEKPNLSIVP